MRSAFHTGWLIPSGPRAGRRRPRSAGCRARRSRRAGRWPRGGRPVRRWPPTPVPAPRPAQAKTRVSSPLRNRWQRTPPVARPLAGYSENGVTFTAPGSVPGSAVDEPETVTTTDDVGVERPERDDVLTGGQLDAGDAAAGAALRAHAAGAEVQQLGVGGDEAEGLLAGGQLDRADDLVAVLEPDHVPLVAAEHLRVDPLHDALPGAEREARARRWRASTARARARRSRAGASR